MQSELWEDIYETQRRGRKVSGRLLGEAAGEVGLVEAVAGGEDLGAGGSRLGDEEVDDVEETVYAVRVVLADGDKGRGNLGGDADGVLDVEVLRAYSQL